MGLDKLKSLIQDHFCQYLLRLYLHKHLYLCKNFVLFPLHNFRSNLPQIVDWSLLLLQQNYHHN